MIRFFTRRFGYNYDTVLRLGLTWVVVDVCVDVNNTNAHRNAGQLSRRLSTTLVL